MLNRLVQLLVVVSWIIALMLSIQEVEQRSSSLPLSHREFISLLKWAGDQAASEVQCDLRKLSRRTDSPLDRWSHPSKTTDVLPLKRSNRIR